MMKHTLVIMLYLAGLAVSEDPEVCEHSLTGAEARADVLLQMRSGSSDAKSNFVVDGDDDASEADERTRRIQLVEDTAKTTKTIGNVGAGQGKTEKKCFIEDVPVFILNLNRRGDRLKWMSELLTNPTSPQWLFENACRVAAVDGQDLAKQWNEWNVATGTPASLVTQIVPATEWQAIIGRETSNVPVGGEALTYGAIGVSLSHLAVWHEVGLSSDPKYARGAIVMEDDLGAFPETFKDEVCSGFDELYDPSYGIEANRSVFVAFQYDDLGASWPKGSDLGQRLASTHNNIVQGERYNTGMYWISKEGARQGWPSFPLKYQLDTPRDRQDPDNTHGWSWLVERWHFEVPVANVGPASWSSDVQTVAAASFASSPDSPEHVLRDCTGALSDTENFLKVLENSEFLFDT